MNDLYVISTQPAKWGAKPLFLAHTMFHGNKDEAQHCSKYHIFVFALV